MPQDLNLSKQLKGRYRLEAIIHIGGMGTVYRGVDEQTKKTCAIKRFGLGHLTSQANIDPEKTRLHSPAQPTLSLESALAQFKDEASVLMRLDHPSLPKVTDMFEDDQEHYYVMTLIEGHDIEDWRQSHLDQLAQPETQQLVLLWIRQIAAALALCHQHHIIHRDIKPGNIVVTPQNTAYLIDFGIAKTREAGQRTTQAARAVSEPYSPLEQYGSEAQVFARTNERSDIYALGMTLWALLSKKLPPSAIERAQGAEFDLGDLGDATYHTEIRTTLRKMTAMRPAERYATMTEVTNALDACLRHIYLAQYEVCLRHAIAQQNKEWLVKNIQIADMPSWLADLLSALDEKNREVQAMQALVAEHQSTISQSDKTLKTLQQQLENNTQLQNANTQSQQELERLQKLHQSTLTEIARLTVLSRDHNQQITSAQSELAELKSLLSKAKQANEQATAEIITLKQLAQKAGDLAASEANLRQQQADQQIERERLQRWERQLAEQAQALQAQGLQKAKESEIEKLSRELNSSILLNSDGRLMPQHDSALSRATTRRSSPHPIPPKVELIFDYEVWKANDKTAQEVSLSGLGDNLEGVFVGLKVEDAYQSGMQQKSRFSAQSYIKIYPPKVSCLSLNLMVQDRLSAVKNLIGTRYISDNTLSPTEVKEAEKIAFGIKFALGNLNSNGIELKAAVNELKMDASEAYFLKLKLEITLD